MPLYNESYIYKDSHGNIISGASGCPNGMDCAKAHSVQMENGNVQKAPKSAEATLIHEIAHPIYEGKGQKNVIKEENIVRDILNIRNRSSSDPEHQ